MGVNREKIIDHIENIFLYLGCANIETSAMDGAVPLDAIAVSQEDSALGMLDSNPLQSGLPTGWNIKTVHFNGESLELMTCLDLHWSKVTSVFSGAVSNARLLGERVQHPDFDCYSQLYYSRINRFGKFDKFRVDRREVINGVILDRIFNPCFTYAYKGDFHADLASANKKLEAEIRAKEANRMLAGIANGMRFHWTAKVRIEKDVPSLTVITDPTGVKELWKLRDIPEGKKRRAALLHWVQSHWRQNRVDPELESFVRKQLRGARTFNHGSLEVEVVPSETASLEVETCKVERAELRTKKQDRRKRNLELRRKLSKSC